MDATNRKRIDWKIVRRLPDWVLPIGVIVLLPIIYFARALLPGQTIFANDMDFAYAAQALLVDSLRQGQLPLWHPYASSGLPLFNWAPLFYPPHLLLSLFIPVNQFFAFSYIFHFSIAGIGTYLFLRQLSASRWGSTIAAMVFMLNGSLILRMFAGHFMYVYAIAWIPLIFYFAEKNLSATRIQELLVMGVALGMQLLCAAVQIWLYTVLILAIYLACRIILNAHAQTRAWRWLTVRAVQYAFAIAIGLGIGAVYWLPAQASLAISVRSGGLDFATASASSLPPTHLANLILPNLFGADLDQNYWGYFLGYISQIESSMYIGILPSLLALLAMKNWRRPAILALTMAVLAALVLAWGRFTPFYRLAFTFVPGLSGFRIPARMLPLFCFGLTSLAGLGLTELERTAQSGRLKRIGCVLIGLGIDFAILFFLLRRWNTAVVSIGENLARLAYASSATEHTRSIDYAFSIVQRVAEILPEQLVAPMLVLLATGVVLLMSRFRLRLAVGLVSFIILLDLAWFSWRYLIVLPVDNILQPTQKTMLAYLGAKPESARLYAEANLLPMNMGNVFGFANVSSGFPQTLSTYRDLINYGTDQLNNAVLDLGFFKQFNARALDLLNVTTTFTLQPIDMPEWQTIAQAPVEILAYDRSVSDYPIPQSATAYVSKNINPLPRAFMVYDERIISDDATALATIYRPDFDPARTVVLDQPVSAMGNPLSLGTVTIQRYTPNALSVAVQTDSAGVLVLSEIYAPDWSATVDGQATPVLRADYTLRAVYVPAGQHTIVMNYAPPGLDIGLAISLGTLAVCVIGWWLSNRIARRQNGAIA